MNQFKRHDRVGVINLFLQSKRSVCVLRIKKNTFHFCLFLHRLLFDFINTRHTDIVYYEKKKSITSHLFLTLRMIHQKQTI